VVITAATITAATIIAVIIAAIIAAVITATAIIIAVAGGGMAIATAVGGTKTSAVDHNSEASGVIPGAFLDANPPTRLALGLVSNPFCTEWGPKMLNRVISPVKILR
jgi:hypothetical protein